jgi:hypothetical protein
MIWWRGHGWLVPLAPILGAFLAVFLIVVGMTQTTTTAFLAGSVVGAGLVWGVGRRGNGPAEGTLMERVFGGRVLHEAAFGESSSLRHAFLGIRMEYWAPAVILVTALALRDRG